MKGRDAITAALAAASVLLAASPALAATTITPDPNAPDSAAGCSLREAISFVNGTGSWTCGPTAGAPYTIDLGSGTYQLTSAPVAPDSNSSGDLNITNPVTIVGSGATISYDTHADRVFDIGAGATVAINGVTITGGQTPNGVDSVTPPGDAGDGGAIRNAGSLTLTDVTLSGNATGRGGNGATNQNGGHGGNGGAIYTTGSLSLTRTTVSGNSTGNGGAGNGTGTGAAAGAGGGVDCFQCTSLSIQASTLNNNTTGDGGARGGSTSGGGNGGALFVFGAPTTIDHTAITGNRTGKGGDLGNAPGGAGGGASILQPTPLVMTDAVVSGNSTGNGGGGGTFTGEGGEGGGLEINGSSTTIQRTTIADNHAGNGGNAGSTGNGGAGGRGGGIELSFFGPSETAVPELSASTISGNSAGKGGSASTNPGGPGYGGGIFVQTANGGSFFNDTVAGNTAGAGGDATGAGNGQVGGFGGGIYVTGMSGQLALDQVTVAGNQAGATGTGGTSPPTPAQSGGLYAQTPTLLQNSIVSANLPANCGRLDNTVLTDGGHDISYADSSCPGINSDPLLGTLADNGGPTKTMALGAGSPAIDLVPTGSNCRPADQRGIARPQLNGCDAGAFEFVPPAPQSGGQQQGGGQQGTPDKTPPRVKLLLKKQKLRNVFKSGYVCNFSTNELGSAVGKLGTAGGGKLTIKKIGRQRLVIKLSKRAKRKYRHAKKVTLRLRLVVKDRAGNATTKTAKVVLKR